MKKHNVVSKRRPRQNILSIILNSAKQRSNSSTGTSNTAPTSKSSSSRSRSNAAAASSPRKSNKLIQSAVELTRRSKSSARKQSAKRGAVFLRGSKAFYRGPKGIEKVTVVGVHHDAKLEPYYTIKFRDGKEKQMDGKCLTPIIEEKRESPKPTDVGGGGDEKLKSYVSSSEPPTDQCSSSSSDGGGMPQDHNHREEEEAEEEDDDRFHQGQDAYYRSPSGGSVTKIKIVEKVSSNKYYVALKDGTKKLVEGETLAGLIDLTSKELASLMKEKNERHSSLSGSHGNGDEEFKEGQGRSLPRRSSNLQSSMQSRESLPNFDQGYEPEMEPSSSENSYEDILNSPNNNGQTLLALPCAVEMVEAKTDDGGTKIVPLYKAEMEVFYRGPQGVATAYIISTHLDDLLEPYYTIRLEDGREKQTDNAHITLEKPVVDEEKPPEEDDNNEQDEDWYQEWKQSQVKDAENLTAELKEYEERSENEEKSFPSTGEHTAKEKLGTTARDPPVIAQDQHSARTKEDQPEPESEPEPTLSALLPKRRASEYSSRTPQVKKQDPDETSALVQAPQYHIGDEVLYSSSKGDHVRATVTKIRKDEKHRPYFVVKLSSGEEKKVYGHRLTAVRRESSQSRTRSRSRSVSRREREPTGHTSKRAASVDCRRFTRRSSSFDSRTSRDESVDRSKSSNDRLRPSVRSSSDRPSRVSRSVSRPPKEFDQSRGRRSESRDPRGRVHPIDEEKSRSRSKSVRESSRDVRSKDSGNEQGQRARSRSRAPEDSKKKSMVSRKAPVTLGVSHRVQHIGGGDDEGSTARSKSSSRFSKLKTSFNIAKAKQRSFA